MEKLFYIFVMFFIFNFLWSGVIVEVRGDVDVMVNKVWTKAKVGMEVGNNTPIMTAIDSYVKVKTGAAFFEVFELSMITFKEKTTDKSSDNQVNLSIGKVKVDYKKPEGIKSSFEVVTPKGTASVRGTEKEIKYYPMKGMEVKVISGSVDIVPGKTLDEKKIEKVLEEKKEETKEGEVEVAEETITEEITVDDYSKYGEVFTAIIGDVVNISADGYMYTDIDFDLNNLGLVYDTYFSDMGKIDISFLDDIIDSYIEEELFIDTYEEILYNEPERL